MYAQIADGKKTASGGPPNHCLRSLRDDLAVFGSTEDSPWKAEVENVSAQLIRCACKWYRGILEAAKRFMGRWHLEVENKSSRRLAAGCVTHKAGRGVGGVREAADVGDSKKCTTDRGASSKAPGRLRG